MISVRTTMGQTLAAMFLAIHVLVPIPAAEFQDLPRSDQAGQELATPRMIRFRQPVALALVEHGKRLLVANRRSGSISEIETQSGRVLAEHDLGQGLVDLVSLSEERHFLALDQPGNALLLLTRQGDSLRVLVPE